VKVATICPSYMSHSCDYSSTVVVRFGNCEGCDDLSVLPASILWLVVVVRSGKFSSRSRRLKGVGAKATNSSLRFTVC
jgi:hypothetical protein